MKRGTVVTEEQTCHLTELVQVMAAHVVAGDRELAAKLPAAAVAVDALVRQGVSASTEATPEAARTTHNTSLRLGHHHSHPCSPSTHTRRTLR
jgi:hypothetical protein